MCRDRLMCVCLDGFSVSSCAVRDWTSSIKALIELNQVRAGCLMNPVTTRITNIVIN